LISPNKLYTTMSYAERQGLFAELNKIYANLPESACRQCARCCAGPPPGYLIEYLNAYRYLMDKPEEERQDIMARVIRYYFLELVEPSLGCPFVGDDSRCVIHPVRPFTCRAYGLLSKVDYEKMDSQGQLEELARLYKKDHDIDIPREIVEFKLPYCENVQPVTGKHIPLEVVQISVRDIGILESSIIPMEVVEENHTFKTHQPQLLKHQPNHGSLHPDITQSYSLSRAYDSLHHNFKLCR